MSALTPAETLLATGLRERDFQRQKRRKPARCLLGMEAILRKGDMAILVSATSSPCTRLILFVLPTPIDRAQRDRNAALLEDSLQFYRGALSHYLK